MARYLPLAPPIDLVERTKYHSVSLEDYTKEYTERVLNKLDPKQVISDLLFISNDKPVILMCYESPDKFCHRHIVAKWLSSHIPTSEFSPTKTLFDD